LSHTVNLAGRTQNNSNTAVDNVFEVNTRLNSSSESPITNGLSDHDGQFITIVILLQQQSLCLLGREPEK
jgi:ABC-type uncharacterized transport system ATPase subunit